MDHTNRQIIRLANDILNPLITLHHKHAFGWADSLPYVLERLQQLTRLRHKVELCRSRSYPAALTHLQTQVVRLLPDLICEIEVLQRMAERPQAAVPSLRDMVGEIHQLDQEFGGYDYNPKTHILSVTTDPIELEGIELGPFRIDLHLAGLESPGSRDLYGIEALEPNPAAPDSGVTHPHVSLGRLCEGDASAPIRVALQQGRICDFFMLVRSVLQTYNPHSPYVSLNNWESQPCYDCGYGMNDDNRYYCESCQNDFCDECIRSCRCCDRSICQGCLVECPHCQEPCCHRCMDVCAACRQPSCPSCLEDDLCPTCKEEQERKDHEQQEQDERDEQEPEERDESDGDEQAVTHAGTILGA